MLGYALRRLILAIPLRRENQAAPDRDLRARQAAARPILELAHAPGTARLRALVLARRPAGAPEDRRAAADHPLAQHRRAVDHRHARDPDRGAVGDAPVLDI